MYIWPSKYLSAPYRVMFLLRRLKVEFQRVTDAWRDRVAGTWTITEQDTRAQTVVNQGMSPYLAQPQLHLSTLQFFSGSHKCLWRARRVRHRMPAASSSAAMNELKYKSLECSL